MKRLSIAPIFISLLLMSPAYASDPAGFFLPDSTHELTIKYRTKGGLIVLPVTINDSVAVNLILDTGCRNLVLFGREFEGLFTLAPTRPVVFSGLGRGKPVTGRLSLGNRVVINEVIGESIPVVVVKDSNIFHRYKNVHGVVGYELFFKFEIELNARANTITFRNAHSAPAPSGSSRVPLTIVDARPLIESLVHIDGKVRKFDLMIDTGSVLGLLLKTTQGKRLDRFGREDVLGVGLCGAVKGYKTVAASVDLSGFKLSHVPAGIVISQWHDNASLGMEVLQDYVVTINYYRGYVAFRPAT